MVYSNIDNSVLSKIDELRLLAATKNPHIISLVEIKPKHGRIPDINTFQIPGYNLYTNNLEAEGVRGVCIYVCSSLKSSVVDIPHNKFQDQLTISVPTMTSSVLFQCVYRSGTPKKAISLDDDMFNLFSETSKLTQHSKHIIVGDFNHDMIQWDPEPMLKENSQPDSPEQKFVDCIRDSFLVQHISQPTRYRVNNRPTKDDLIFSKDDLIFSTHVDNIVYNPSIGLSDHLEIQSLSNKKIKIFNVLSGLFCML